MRCSSVPQCAVRPSRAGMAARAKAGDRPDSRNTKLNRMEENIGALEVELTADDLRIIEDATAKITVNGARYPGKFEKMTGR